MPEKMSLRRRALALAALAVVIGDPLPGLAGPWTTREEEVFTDQYVFSAEQSADNGGMSLTYGCNSLTQVSFFDVGADGTFGETASDELVPATFTIDGVPFELAGRYDYDDDDNVIVTFGEDVLGDPVYELFEAMSGATSSIEVRLLDQAGNFSIEGAKPALDETYGLCVIRGPR